MKRNMIILTIVFGMLLLTTTNFSPDRIVKALNQSKAGQDQTKPQSPPPVKPTVPVEKDEKPIRKVLSWKPQDGNPQGKVDIDGKRISDGEKYVAQRTLKNGKVIAYRQNKREAGALVKALKEDGVTDKKLLDTNYWLQLSCSFIAFKQCSGKCPGCKYFEPDLRGTDQTTRKLAPTALGICICP